MGEPGGRLRVPDQGVADGCGAGFLGHFDQSIGGRESKLAFHPLKCLRLHGVFGRESIKMRARQTFAEQVAALQSLVADRSPNQELASKGIFQGHGDLRSRGSFLGPTAYSQSAQYSEAKPRFQAKRVGEKTRVQGKFHS